VLRRSTALKPASSARRKSAVAVNNNVEKFRNFFSQNFEISRNSAQFRDSFRASDLCRKGGFVKNLSIHHQIK
jgi:hypothetical protein